MSREMTPSGHSARPGRLAGLLGLDRNTGAVALAVFTMALGEHLWRKFLPKYLEALGAPLVAIGAYGSTQDLLDGLYQYPGGWLSDRFGRQTRASDIHKPRSHWLWRDRWGAGVAGRAPGRACS